MSFKIKFFNEFDKKEWNSLLNNLHGNLYQNTWEILNYRSNLSNTINKSFAMFEGAHCLALVSLGLFKNINNKFNFSFGGSTYCPEPIFSKKLEIYTRKKIINHTWEIISDLGKKLNCDNYKFNTHPIIFNKKKAKLDFTNKFYYLKWCDNYHVNNTIVIELNQDERKLWNNLSKYHRKNIRRAEEKKVKINCINHKTKKSLLEKKILSFKFQ